MTTETLNGWRFVGAEDVAVLHRYAVETYGGLAGVTAGCVEASIGAAKTAAIYLAEENGVDLLTASAHLLCYLAKNHCFTDGNKRVAWMALIRAFDANGLTIIAEEQDAAELVENVVGDRVDVGGVIRWLAQPGRIAPADASTA